VKINEQPFTTYPVINELIVLRHIADDDKLLLGLYCIVFSFIARFTAGRMQLFTYDKLITSVAASHQGKCPGRNTSALAVKT